MSVRLFCLLLRSAPRKGAPGWGVGLIALMGMAWPDRRQQFGAQDTVHCPGLRSLLATLLDEKVPPSAWLLLLPWLLCARCVASAGRLVKSQALSGRAMLCYLELC